MHRTTLAALATSLAVAIVPAPALAAPDDQGIAREGGIGAAAAVASLVYAPAKLLYAISGIALGAASLLWTWGDQETAMSVVTKSVGGDYVITPDHLGGAQDIRFTGG